MSEDRHSNGRLDSWKEIAAYLNRDVRTVIRWECKGLPVHRVPGGKRQAVFAYPAEIDAWLSGEHNGQNHQDRPGELNSISQSAEDISDSAPGMRADHSAIEPLNSPKLQFQRHKTFMALVAVLFMLLGIAAFFSRSSTSAAVRPFSFRQLTDDGRAKMNLRTDGKNLYFDEFEVNREILVTAPIGGGPTREIKTPFANVELQDVLENGKSILVTSFEGSELDRPLWIVSTGDRAPIRVGDILCRVARWSPSDHRVACGNGTSITLLGLDGSHPRTIGHLPGVVWTLAWSPDGHRLRFVLQDLHTHDYSAWEIDASNDAAGENQPSATRLPWGENCCADWTWTGNGERFLYLKTETRPVLREQIRGLSGVSEIPISIGSTAWLAGGKSPDSAYLLVQHTLQNQVLKFDPQRKTFQTVLPSLSATFLSFSRDGQWMTYLSRDTSLWRSRVDGSDALQITKLPMEVELSSWSPDGTQIAFMAREPGRVWRIYLVGRDGGELREASASDDGQGAPTWSPDGRKIVYGNVDCAETNNCWIRTIDLQSKRVEKISGSHGFRTARWSPDGKYIAAFQPEEHQLLLFNVSRRQWALLADNVTGDNLGWSHDSQYVYADSPRGKRPVIERFRIRDGHRSTVVSLDPLEKVAGEMDFWFGLTAQDELLLVHIYNSSEAYALNWADR